MVRFIIAICCILLPINSLASNLNPLEKVVKEVSGRYTQIQHISSEEMSKQLLNKKDVIIFDVREKEEYEMSRLPGAIQVNPSIWTSRFLKKYKAILKGKDVIFYCSVGVRSSKLAVRVKDELQQNGTKEISNLSGGIFEWSIKGYQMINNQGPAKKVHTYNHYWGTILESSR